MFATESMTAGKTITETYAKRAMRERHKAGYTAEIKDVVNGYGVNFGKGKQSKQNHFKYRKSEVYKIN